jgi:hypothetical protein
MEMKLQHLEEPRLVFAYGEHVCPRHGIAAYRVFDATDSVRRDRVLVGAIGDSVSLEAFNQWLERCRNAIDRDSSAVQENLFPSFCGFKKGEGFDADLVTHADLQRQLRNTDVAELIEEKTTRQRVQKAVDLFYEEVKFLSEHRQVDVIVCVIPDRLHKVIAFDAKDEPEESLDASHDVTGEMNFRRALKAKAMHLGKPLQLMRETSLQSRVKTQQDDATKAWNFCSALYYKSGPTIPWKLASAQARPTSCALGISFYRSRDLQSLNTSLAQIFDELGNGLILRGTPVDISREDRNPHLSREQASQLFRRALEEYRVAMKTMPARVVVHKTSSYSQDEIAGFDEVAQELRIHTVDFVTVLDSKLRVFRKGQYPPYRGTFVSLTESRHLLYTRGSVWFYETYPGGHIPEPIEIRIVRSEESPTFLAAEILGLTKMNWNNTQFDGKYPVTLGCARKVGEILKYLGEHERTQSRYSYYM